MLGLVVYSILDSLPSDILYLHFLVRFDEAIFERERVKFCRAAFSLGEVLKKTTYQYETPLKVVPTSMAITS